MHFGVRDRRRTPCGYLIADRTDARIFRDEVTKPGAVRFIVQRRDGGISCDTNGFVAQGLSE